VFLKSNKSRLFMIDSDQTWKAQDAIRLLALSTKMAVVVGAYPAKKDPPTYFLSPEDGDAVSNEYGCIPIKGIGLGFTVVRREIIESLADRAPKVTFPDSSEKIAHIFRCDVVGDVFRGEDMAFFEDVRSLGYTVYLDPAVSIGHVGAKEFRADIYNALQRL